MLHVFSQEEDQDAGPELWTQIMEKFNHCRRNTERPVTAGSWWDQVLVLVP